MWLVNVWFWGWWIATLVRVGPWDAFASRWWGTSRGSRTHRFLRDWCFLFLAPFVAFVNWPPLWPRLVIVVGATVVTFVLRLRSEDTWRLYEPPLSKWPPE